MQPFTVKTLLLEDEDRRGGPPTQEESAGAPSVEILSVSAWCPVLHQAHCPQPCSEQTLSYTDPPSQGSSWRLILKLTQVTNSIRHRPKGLIQMTRSSLALRREGMKELSDILKARELSASRQQGYLFWPSDKWMTRAHKILWRKEGKKGRRKG